MSETPCQIGNKCKIVWREETDDKGRSLGMVQVWSCKGTSEQHDLHPDDWYHDPGSGRDTEAGKQRRRAIQACHTECRLRVQCMAQAFDKRETIGIWGGYTEKERAEVFQKLDERQRREAEAVE